MTVYEKKAGIVKLIIPLNGKYKYYEILNVLY